LVRNEIARRVKAGISNRCDLEASLSDWVKTTFPHASKTDTRYYPSLVKIGKAMAAEALKSRYSLMDEKNLVGKVRRIKVYTFSAYGNISHCMYCTYYCVYALQTNQWKEERPNDLFFYRPYHEVDEDITIPDTDELRLDLITSVPRDSSNRQSMIYVYMSAQQKYLLKR